MIDSISQPCKKLILQITVRGMTSTDYQVIRENITCSPHQVAAQSRLEVLLEPLAHQRRAVR
jgi:hypothetical protein